MYYKNHYNTVISLQLIKKNKNKKEVHNKTTFFLSSQWSVYF